MRKPPRSGRRASRLGAVALAVALLLRGADAAASEPEIRTWVDSADPIAAHLTDGAWTLVMFWSIDCGICANETPGLSAFAEQERGNGVRLLGVSIDGAGKRTPVAGWMHEHRMRFPTLLGDLTDIADYFRRATAEAFRGTPTFILLDPRGQIVGVNTGPVRVQAVRDFIARKRGPG